MSLLLDIETGMSAVLVQQWQWHSSNRMTSNSIGVRGPSGHLISNPCAMAERLVYLHLLVSHRPGDIPFRCLCLCCSGHRGIINCSRTV